jgi:transcriptional regulator with XRE-family HTH domain
MRNKIDPDLKSIGQRLLAVRKHFNLNQEEIGKITGYSKSLISAAEKGEKKPSSQYLYGLLTQFDVDVNWILTGKGEMLPDSHNESPEDKDVNELFKMMKKVKILRYAVLAFYYEYLKRNEELIDKILEEE